MDRDHIRNHIEAAARRQTPEAWRLGLRMLRSSWPGGPDDRTEPAALRWLRRWRPETAGTALPVCSCADGHCVVCN
jgi:hypothetical protein